MTRDEAVKVLEEDLQILKKAKSMGLTENENVELMQALTLAIDTLKRIERCRYEIAGICSKNTTKDSGIVSCCFDSCNGKDNL
jgi:hypothetical protein